MGSYGIIYLITFIKQNTQDHYYIGQTTQNLRTRIIDGHINRAWKTDSNGNFENNYRVAREIRKYKITDKVNDVIWEDKNYDIYHSKTYIKITILDTAESQEELDYKEKKHIIEYNSYEHINGSRGFNGTLGGYGNSSRVLKGENASEAQLTNFEAKQARLLNRDTSLIYKELANLFNCSIGCIYNVINDKTYIDALINKNDVLDKQYEHWINYAPLSRRNKLFYSYDLRKSDTDEERVKIWSSPSECAKELGEGVKAQYISYALSEKRSIIAKHFVFVREKNSYEFKKNRLPELQMKHDNKYRTFSAYDKTTGKYIDTYDRMGTCLKKLKLKNNAPIYNCLKGKTSHSDKFIYIYDDEFTPELLKKKIKKANSRSFYMFDMDGTKMGDSWTVVKKCAEMFNIDASSISRCLKSQNPYKNKYIFLYSDQYSKELLNTIIDSINNKERYFLFNLEGKSLGISESQYDLYHNKKVFTTSYALKKGNYYIPSKGLIVIPESVFSFKTLNLLLKKAKVEYAKYTQSRTISNKKILIYSKDCLLLELPNARAALESDIIPLHAAYRVPRRENKIYKNLIIIFEEDATPSVLMKLRKKLGKKI